MPDYTAISSEITEHIEWLERAVAQLLADITIMDAEIDYVEKKIKLFLNEYYNEVGKYFSDLSRINARIRSLANGGGNGVAAGGDKKNSDLNDYDVFAGDKNLGDEIGKRLYRKIAKNCHPDTSSLPDAAEVFARANEAYSKADLSTLVYIEQAMEERNLAGQDPVQRLERLEKKYELLRREKDIALKRRASLRESPAYRLWQKVSQERARGYDLVREIKNSVMQEISSKKQYLEVRGS